MLQAVYFGTPKESALLLEKILNDKNLSIKINLVITQPDRPIGRKKIITSCPVKQLALKHKLAVYDTAIKTLPKDLLKKIDIGLMLFYGQIIPKEFLVLPKYGIWNVHFSLLPQYRGPTPVTYSLIMGDKKTAISLVLTDIKLDNGPLISQDEVVIDKNERRPEFEKKLSILSFDIIKRELREIVNLKSKLKSQDHTKATYTLFPTRNHGFIPLPVLKKALKNEPLTVEEIPSLIKKYFIKNSKKQETRYKQILNPKNKKIKQIQLKNFSLENWQLIENLKLKIEDSSEIIYNYFRGLYPWPGLWTKINIKGQVKRLKILDLELKMLNAPCSTLNIKTVQLEGKNPVSFQQFQKAYQNII